MTYILTQLQELMRTARDTYGVDPVIFLVLYVLCAPPWYYSMFRTLRAFATQRTNEIMVWTTVFLVTSVLPFVYVMIFGRNLPWWVYAIIAALVLQVLLSLRRRLRRRPSDDMKVGRP